jgi:deoxycytidylate deaminase
MGDDVESLLEELPDAELVFAIVSPLGTPTDIVQDSIAKAIKQHEYELATVIRISALLDELRPTENPKERPAERQERLMEAGNELRRAHDGDYLALMAVAAINAKRPQDSENRPKPYGRRVHLIRSLKHPDEVTRLRNIYGKGFFLLGVSAPRRLRHETLANKNFQRDEVERLLDKDAAEIDKIGQQTRDTFELADAYIRIEGGDETVLRGKVLRVVDLLLSCPFLPPTEEEHAMFMAYAAALRSGDLSRQVGAVVANRAGDVIASGANEAPAPEGRRYWPEPEGFDATTRPLGGPDYERGFDSNERERNKILVGVIRALVPGEPIPDDPSPEERADLVEKYKTRLAGTGILDLTEFGRAVHAEMAALMACARSGVSPREGTLYCTTFPCHNCAKHIVASGIKKVVYVEPYPKSKAQDLHADALCLPDEDEHAPSGNHVQFRAFEGIGPRRFVDLFSLSLGSGRPIRRKQQHADGKRIEWKRGEGSHLRLPLDPRSYLQREDAACTFFRQRKAKDAKVQTLDARPQPDATAGDANPDGSS